MAPGAGSGAPQSAYDKAELLHTEERGCTMRRELLKDKDAWDNSTGPPALQGAGRSSGHGDEDPDRLLSALCVYCGRGAAEAQGPLEGKLRPGCAGL